jgi:hypothetical protein
MQLIYFLINGFYEISDEFGTIYFLIIGLHAFPVLFAINYSDLYITGCQPSDDGSLHQETCFSWAFLEPHAAPLIQLRRSRHESRYSDH